MTKMYQILSKIALIIFYMNLTLLVIIHQAMQMITTLRAILSMLFLTPTSTVETCTGMMI